MIAEANEATHPVFVGVDDHIAHAVLYRDIPEEVADKSAHAWFVGALVASVNISVDGEVDELGAARHGGERSDELGIDGVFDTTIKESQPVAAAIEGAAEFMATTTRHASDHDVVVQHDGLAAERLATLHLVAEQVPARDGVDGVGVTVL